jgi:hypothetical protein
MDASPSSFDAFLASALGTAPEPQLPTRLTHRNLTNAIASALYHVSAHDLADECVRLGLAAESPGEPGAMSGKIRYVTRRLRDFSTEQLIELGRKVNDDYDSAELTHLLALAGAHGVEGELKNLIFAADGPKPKIVLRDAISNTIEVTENAESCLIYDQALPQSGLTWRELTRWWGGGAAQVDKVTEVASARTLYRRLLLSMQDNGAERFLFSEYCKLYASHGFDVPALIPQVYLHYDPYTRGAGATLVRQRMDFLILLPGRRRIVLELDGIQHYSDTTGRSSPKRYAAMAQEDRKLRLAGYEVYRFGGQELADREAARVMLGAFFFAVLGFEVGGTGEEQQHSEREAL